MILIKSVQIIDGARRPPFKGDILVRGKKILAIGKLAHKKAEKVIDGFGFFAAPGFIDSFSGIDHDLSLFNNPLQEKYVTQGVTTAIGGHRGVSLAPILYGSLSLLNKWANARINIDWRTIAELKVALNQLGLGVNFGTLAGHYTIRHDIAKDNVRDLTEPETDVFKKILEQTLAEGALGISVDFTRSPVRYTPYSEVRKLFPILAARKGIYAIHARNLEEAIRSAEESRVPTVISNFQPPAEFDVNKRLASSDIYFNTEGIFHPRALISGIKGFAEYLESASRKKIPVEEVVWQATSLPAKVFGIKKRGALKEGWFADIIMFKENKIENVLINGKLSLENGKITKKMNGLCF